MKVRSLQLKAASCYFFVISDFHHLLEVQYWAAFASPSKANGSTFNIIGDRHGSQTIAENLSPISPKRQNKVQKKLFRTRLASVAYLSLYFPKLGYQERTKMTARERW